MRSIPHAVHGAISDCVCEIGDSGVLRGGHREACQCQGGEEDEVGLHGSMLLLQ